MPLLNSKIPKTLDREYNVAIGKHSKADELLGQGKVAEAESLLRAALNWSQQSLGGAHEMTVSFQEDLAVFLAQVGKFDEAIEVNMAAWQTREKARDSSRSRHKAHLNLALDLTHQGRLMEAASHFERVYASQLSDTATFGADDLQTLSTGHELATCWFQLGHQKKTTISRSRPGPSTRTCWSDSFATETLTPWMSSGRAWLWEKTTTVLRSTPKRKNSSTLARCL
ncbi:hypothetical protein PG999_004298 [Apiospora kogelbergensis]|uniref:Tetratricopeptide repeat-containing protein n=1 Tax=Apiospora kogelbergensis TaxID=1337665 RepID=A0AAW0QYZ7_9PEZI